MYFLNKIQLLVKFKKNYFSALRQKKKIKGERLTMHAKRCGTLTHERWTVRDVDQWTVYCIKQTVVTEWSRKRARTKRPTVRKFLRLF